MRQVSVSVAAPQAESGSRIRTILASVAAFGALSVLPKLLAIAKDMVVALHFGAGQALDAYLMAFVLIGVPVSIIVVALQTTLIPALVGKDDTAAAGLLGGAIKLALASLALALPVWLLLLPHALGALYPGTPDTTRQHLLEACYWLIPYYFINGINLLLYGALQARKRFWPNALLPGLFPLAILAAVLVVQTDDIRALLVGTVAGSLLEGLALYVLLHRAKLLRWCNTAGSGLLPVLRGALPLMAGGVITATAPIVEQLIAFRLGSGAVSLLSYGYKVPAAMNSLVVAAIGIVVLPHFAELLARQEWRSCRGLFLRLTGVALALGGAVAFVGFLLAEPVIRLLFERGAFTASDSATAAAVMRAYLLQLPFLLVVMVSQRALAAMNDTVAMALIAGLQLLLAGALAYALSQHFGVVGVALGTALATLVGSLILGMGTLRRLNTSILSLAA